MCSCKKALPINCHSKQLKMLGKLFSKKKTSYLFNTYSMSFSTSHILPKLTASAIHTIMMSSGLQCWVRMVKDYFHSQIILEWGMDLRCVCYLRDNLTCFNKNQILHLRYILEGWQWNIITCRNWNYDATTKPNVTCVNYLKTQRIKSLWWFVLLNKTNTGQAQALPTVYNLSEG